MNGLYSFAMVLRSRAVIQHRRCTTAIHPALPGLCEAGHARGALQPPLPTKGELASFDDERAMGHEQTIDRASPRIPSLDGLRAVSIGLVIVAHAIFSAGFVTASNQLHWLEALAGLGVRVFFVISGYLITNLLLSEIQINGRLHLPRFYLRRTLRIFLPYYCFLGMVIILAGLHRVTLSYGDIWHAATYTVNYYSQRSWYIGHAWSLSVEEQFYLLWPAVLLLAGIRRGMWGALLFALLTPVTRVAYHHYVPSLSRYEIGYRFETAADAIAIGCLLAGSSAWLQRNSYYQRAIRSQIMILAPIIVLCASELNPESKRYLLMGVSIQNLGIAVCIAWCVANFATPVGRLLNCGPMTFIGRISYSLYLWQQLFLAPHSSVFVSRFLANLLLVVIASICAHYLVERPALELRKRLEKRLLGS
jgi:peptidoglycan/LPS O-acetylase OafA/YrhL